MELDELINKDIRNDIVSKDPDKVEALRAIKAALLFEVELNFSRKW